MAAMLEYLTHVASGRGRRRQFRNVQHLVGDQCREACNRARSCRQGGRCCRCCYERGRKLCLVFVVRWALGDGLMRSFRVQKSEVGQRSEGQLRQVQNLWGRPWLSMSMSCCVCWCFSECLPVKFFSLSRWARAPKSARCRDLREVAVKATNVTFSCLNEMGDPVRCVELATF